MKFETIRTHHPHYPFVEDLFVTAFPENERRPLEKQRTHIDSHPRFSCLLVSEDERPVGFITVWDFGSFRYGEHFAIDPTLRNGGFGARTVQALLSQNDRPFVLEVELPDTELSRRRIGFYERQGFRVWTKDYVQPPYREGDEPLPMYLMIASDGKSGALDTDEVVRTIHREVYGYNKE